MIVWYLIIIWNIVIILVYAKQAEKYSKANTLRDRGLMDAAFDLLSHWHYKPLKKTSYSNYVCEHTVMPLNKPFLRNTQNVCLWEGRSLKCTKTLVNRKKGTTKMCVITELEEEKFETIF